MKKIQKTALNCLIPSKLMKDLDNKANEMGIPKTSLVIIAINQYLKTDKTVEVLGKATKLIEKERN